MDSILTSIKKLIGPTEEDTSFDPDITIHINSAIATLTQIGVGSNDGFTVTDKNDLWTDFIEDDPKLLGFVKTYVYLKVRLVFDPPASSTILAAMERQASELESRISMTVDPAPAT